MDPATRRRASEDWRFRSLGRHRLKGQSKPIEIFSLDSLSPLRVTDVYERIEAFLSRLSTKTSPP